MHQKVSDAMDEFTEHLLKCNAEGECGECARLDLRVDFMKVLYPNPHLVYSADWDN